jgi:hypothetical protein
MVESYIAVMGEAMRNRDEPHINCNFAQAGRRFRVRALSQADSRSGRAGLTGARGPAREPG